MNCIEVVKSEMITFFNRIVRESLSEEVPFEQGRVNLRQRETNVMSRQECARHTGKTAQESYVMGSL